MANLFKPIFYSEKIKTFKKKYVFTTNSEGNMLLYTPKWWDPFLNTAYAGAGEL